MKNTFKVNVDDSFEFDITNDELLKIDSIQKSDTAFHVLQHGKSIEVIILESDFYNKKYKVAIGANIYYVSMINDLAILIKEMGLSLGAAKQVDFVKAPMPGLIIDINVSPGQEIKENESLIVVEAMKMENILVAPRDGIIKSVEANKGDTVDKGALLIELEALVKE